MSLKKLKFLIPTAILFGSPWTHKLIYLNLLAAWPDFDHEGAHWVGILGAVAAFTITTIWAVTEKEKEDRLRR